MTAPILLTVSILALFASRTFAGADDSIAVSVVGTLRTGVAAIDDETTGATITAKGITWELDFEKNHGLRKTAEKFNDRKVSVTGSLEHRNGVGIKERWIVVVTGLNALVETGADDTGKPVLLATVRRDSRIQFITSHEMTILDITSASGIDSATIRRKPGRWPKSMLVRLRLSGLELFRAGGNGAAVQWSVASTGDHATRVSLRKDKTETALGAKHPYFTALRIVGGNGAIPLKGGYFEIPLPAKLFEANPEEIELNWIDFYR